MMYRIQLFILILFVSVLLFVLSIPKYTYITYNNLSNLISQKGSSVGDCMLNLRIYSKDKSLNLYDLFSDEKSIVIIDNCPCKRDLVNKYLNDHLNKIIYIYVREAGYKSDIYHKQSNVSVYRLSVFDMLMEFSHNEYKEFPIVYTVDEGGKIIAKDL